jgi:hypothetical protein
MAFAQLTYRESLRDIEACLIPAGKPAQSAVALIALNATAKLSIGKETD